MEMYIRIIKTEDALNFVFKNDSDKLKAMMYNMVDWRVNVENGIITSVILKADIDDEYSISYYEGEYEKILKRFYGEKNKVFDLLSSI